MSERWALVDAERGADTHIWPIADLREHEETRKCWCRPSVEAVEGGVLVTHHSMDGRELVEKHGAN